MLDAVAELGQDAVGDIGRVLGDEIDPDSLGADQAHDLFDLFQQGFGRVPEQQVGLVEEEDETRFLGVADLWQLFEQLGHQPQQEGAVQARAVHQPRRVQHIDLTQNTSLAVQRRPHHVGQFQSGFAEEGVAAVLFQLQQGALDRGDRGGGYIADLATDAGGVLGDIGQHRPKIVEVEQQQAFLVGDVEGDRQHPLLHVVEVQHPGHQQRSDFRYGRPDRVPLLPVQIPEHRRRGLRRQGQVHPGGAGQ